MATELIQDPYVVLGLTDGSAATTDAEIKKARRLLYCAALSLTQAQAYRKQALARHPDKRPAAERAGVCLAHDAVASAL